MRSPVSVVLYAVLALASLLSPPADAKSPPMLGGGAQPIPLGGSGVLDTGNFHSRDLSNGGTERNNARTQLGPGAPSIP